MTVLEKSVHLDLEAENHLDGVFKTMGICRTLIEEHKNTLVGLFLCSMYCESGPSY